MSVLGPRRAAEHTPVSCVAAGIRGLRAAWARPKVEQGGGEAGSTC